MTFFELNLCGVLIDRLPPHLGILGARPNLSDEQEAAVRHAVGWDGPELVRLRPLEAFLAQNLRSGPFLISEENDFSDDLQVLQEKGWLFYKRYTDTCKNPYNPLRRAPWYGVVGTYKGFMASHELGDE